MKSASTLTIITAITGLSALPAFGGTQDRVPPDNLAVWIFLGFCALIVLAQLVPMIRTLLQKKNTADHAETIHAPSHTEVAEQSDTH